MQRPSLVSVDLNEPVLERQNAFKEPKRQAKKHVVITILLILILLLLWGLSLGHTFTVHHDLDGACQKDAGLSQQRAANKWHESTTVTIGFLFTDLILYVPVVIICCIRGFSPRLDKGFTNRSSPWRVVLQVFVLLGCVSALMGAFVLQGSTDANRGDVKITNGESCITKNNSVMYNYGFSFSAIIFAAYLLTIEPAIKNKCFLAECECNC